jgi:hypothetical protein
MPEVQNPYAPPKSSLEPEGVRGFWRDGKILVLRMGSLLPNRCVKCNAPAEEPIKQRKVYWHHPVIYLVLFLNVLIYILVALVARKNAKINPGLCANHRKRRYLAIGLGWTGIILGALFAVVGGINDIPAFLLFGIVFLLGSSIAGLIFARIVFPKKIDKEFVFLKGCGNDFLDSLPDFKA